MWVRAPKRFIRCGAVVLGGGVVLWWEGAGDGVREWCADERSCSVIVRLDVSACGGGAGGAELKGKVCKEQTRRASTPTERRSAQKS